ncbi:zinc finger domain-containing protein [Cryptosporidium ubiquitum]|uniref:Zinc finger domain-containing protein n=1 Tax=Cryptosporidium ubiquitum TaxID=857276 RepID=A0A1J4MKC1_9CRYT|nr:zinc finger domain-containing protein [Cryptosporidium ubiquitum]OII74471.1 zinc finger domain-containing protein [Cryptosporidium ubiquitum]
MGRKKRKVAEIKPFCYYCNREFGDEKVLKQHQKVRHLKCLHCSRKLSTVSGLIVHMLQVHKETLSRIPNAIPGRDIPDIVINGMKGVPSELIEERIKEQNVEIDIQKDIKSYNPHGNKMMALMNDVAKEFVKEHSKLKSNNYQKSQISKINFQIWEIYVFQECMEGRNSSSEQCFPFQIKNQSQV